MAKDEKTMQAVQNEAQSAPAGDDVASLKRLLADQQAMLSEQRQQIDRLLSQQQQQPVNASINFPNPAKEEMKRYNAMVLSSDELVHHAESLLLKGEFFVKVAIVDQHNQAKIAEESKKAGGRHLEAWEFVTRPWNPWRIVGVHQEGEGAIYEAIAKYNRFFGITAVYDPAKHVSYRCTRDGEPILDGKQFGPGVRGQFIDAA